MKNQPEQEINIWSTPPGAGQQKVYVNPPGGRPPEPHYAGGTAQLVIVVAVALFLVVVGCGVASALTAGAIW